MRTTKEELCEAAFEMTGGSPADLSVNNIRRLMTITQYVTDLCLNEVERRGELTFRDGMPIVPYQCEYGLRTILTRPIAD